jgi:hypothetical protein
MIEKSSDPPSLRDLRFLRLMIDVVGKERHTVSLRQLEAWLNQMVGRPLTAKSSNTSQFTKNQDAKGEAAFRLSVVESNDQPSSRELRLLRLMISITGGDGAVSMRQLREWLNGMIGRPLAAKNGDLSQLTRQDAKGEVTFWLSAVKEEVPYV